MALVSCLQSQTGRNWLYNATVIIALIIKPNECPSNKPLEKCIKQEMKQEKAIEQ